MTYENQPNYVDETPGKKIYCTCGESAKKPYCDGSHEMFNTGKSPKPKEWLFVTVANPANYPFVTALTQSCSFE